ncbi:protein AMBP isoform X2 [Gadus morhua]|uniref:protein AMBP isoform X2 n=1 Tax=Gadus morhua TaxID=8049 RepID=UPI0011B6947A|nr:protein AMBP-like isoform X2 [Gadus morhua]
MLVAQVLGSLLVLGWVASLQGLQAPLYTTQENFNLDSFLGKWHDLATATDCPHEGHSTADRAIGTLEMKAGLEAGKILTKRTALRGEVCKEMSFFSEVTTTPGRFFYRSQRWQAEMDAYVVHTNYQEYAIVITSRQKSSGNATVAMKLLSRTREVRDTVMDDFKTLVSSMGIAEDSIVINQDKGDCVPGEVTATEGTPRFRIVQRKRRDTEPEPAEAEGSGVAATEFTDAASCMDEPDSGPCFGALQHYHYNSSSMSCQEFQYGGCMGNQNNFVTERECLQRCRTEAACRLPMVAQPCTGQPAVWAFDATSGLCLAYKPGFCQGNGNKFYSKAECEEYCGVVKEESSAAGSRMLGISGEEGEVTSQR